LSVGVPAGLPLETVDFVRSRGVARIQEYQEWLKTLLLLKLTGLLQEQ